MSYAPHLVSVETVPIWGSVRPTGVRPAMSPRGTKKTVPTQAYRSLIAAFENMEGSAAECVYDPTIHTARTVLTSLTTARGTDYAHIEIVMRGDRVYLRKQGLPGVDMLVSRLGRSMMRMVALQDECDRYTRERDGLTETQAPLLEIVQRAVSEAQRAVDKENKRQAVLRENIAALERGERVQYRS